MLKRLILIATLGAALAGCKALDGDYYPACKAFEGDHIRLESDRFVWDRFTDQVRVDADRNVIDPFPDYPREGRVERDGDMLSLVFADDGATKAFHVVIHDERTWLLTDEQHAAFEAEGQIAACALARERE